MRYVQPRSLTWWAGVLSTTTGAAALAMPEAQPVSEFGRLLAMFAGSGDASPASLIFLGLGLIGVRDRLKRGFGGDD